MSLRGFPFERNRLGGDSWTWAFEKVETPAQAFFPQLRKHQHSEAMLRPLPRTTFLLHRHLSSPQPLSLSLLSLMPELPCAVCTPIPCVR